MVPRRVAATPPTVTEVTSDSVLLFVDPEAMPTSTMRLGVLGVKVRDGLAVPVPEPVAVLSICTPNPGGTGGAEGSKAATEWLIPAVVSVFDQL
jgi:hypothetical protein